MKSGLEGRNNGSSKQPRETIEFSLNEVRPRRPEQYPYGDGSVPLYDMVSMKSGLEGRNNMRESKGIVLNYGSQ